jgi:hypothetical protein
MPAKQFDQPMPSLCLQPVLGLLQHLLPSLEHRLWPHAPESFGKVTPTDAEMASSTFRAAGQAVL